VNLGKFLEPEVLGIMKSGKQTLIRRSKRTPFDTWLSGSKGKHIFDDVMDDLSKKALACLLIPPLFIPYSFRATTPRRNRQCLLAGADYKNVYG